MSIEEYLIFYKELITEKFRVLKSSGNIAWKTKVWLSESAEHMIHLNGDRFMGPRD